jgi:hypothetical protein
MIKTISEFKCMSKLHFRLSMSYVIFVMFKLIEITMAEEQKNRLNLFRAESMINFLLASVISE